jgi:hypothetical protein
VQPNRTHGRASGKAGRTGRREEHSRSIPMPIVMKRRLLSASAPKHGPRNSGRAPEASASLETMQCIPAAWRGRDRFTLGSFRKYPEIICAAGSRGTPRTDSRMRGIVPIPARRGTADHFQPRHMRMKHGALRSRVVAPRCVASGGTATSPPRRGRHQRIAAAQPAASGNFLAYTIIGERKSLWMPSPNLLAYRVMRYYPGAAVI